MGIDAISGYGSQDYSWYTPGTAGISDDFDMALNAADDAADAIDAEEAFSVAAAQNVDVSERTYARVEPAEQSERFWGDTMKDDNSSMRVDMEQLLVAAMGFHTKRRLELLGL